MWAGVTSRSGSSGSMNVTSLGRLCCWPRPHDRDGGAPRGTDGGDTPASLLEEVTHRRDWGPGDRPRTPPPDPDLLPDITDTPAPARHLALLPHTHGDARPRVCSDGDMLLGGPARPESGAFSETEVSWQKEPSPPEPCSETAI